MCSGGSPRDRKFGEWVTVKGQVGRFDKPSARHARSQRQGAAAGDSFQRRPGYVPQTGYPLSKQNFIIAFQPSTEGVEIAALQRKPQPNRHQLAWPQLRLRMFRYVAHLVIKGTKQHDDKIFGSHDWHPYTSGFAA